MDFELGEEVAIVRDMSREGADKELAPRAAQHDREETIDPAVFGVLAELGLWGLTIPEDLGGAGMGNLALAIVLEEVNRGCAATGVTLSVHNSLVAAPIRRFGPKLTGCVKPVSKSEKFSSAATRLTRLKA